MANWKPIAILLLGCLGLTMILAVWAGDSGDFMYDDFLESDEETTLDGPLAPQELDITDPEVTNDMNPIATFATNRGTIKLELFEDQMPVTVGNFVTLADDGYYDGTKFHRIIEGFMIQGGDPNSRTDDTQTYGTGGPGYTIQDEFVNGELLTNTRGTIAMANTGQPNSGGSQFFINTADNSNLDFDKTPLSSRHPVFGRVIEGLGIVDQIEQVPTDPRDVPIDPVVIESVSIEREAAGGETATNENIGEPTRILGKESSKKE